MLLSAKLTRPGYPSAVVDRPRLYRRLDRWREVRAVVIRAPAGHGKSSLVSRWLDAAGLDARAAWVTLDEGESDPRQFVHYIAAALETVRPGALALAQPILEDRQGNADRALTRVLSAFDDLTPAQDTDRHVLLVLDDFHRARAPEVDALVLKVLEHGPASLHLILAARHLTDLPLARLHAHERVVELTGEDLRFNDDEITAYLLGHGFATPDALDVAEVAQRSEGWITALQLGVLSLRRRGDVRNLLDALRGDRDWLAGFLTEEVLNRQTAEVRRFLLLTSILDEFNAPLCAAVAGEATAHAHLAALARADLFLIRLDDAANWFRYHHLFQELLRRRLLAEIHSGEHAELHRRAAKWLAQTGRVDAAVGHFLAAGDEDDAAELVETHMRAALLRSPYDARHLFDLLPERVVQRRPRLLLDRCFLALLFDGEGLPELVQRAGELLGELNLSPQAAPAFHGEWLFMSGAVAHLQSDLAAAARNLDAAEKFAGVMSDHVVGSADFLRMHLRHHEGRLADAEQSAQRALDAYGRARFSMGTMAIRREVARWRMRAGKSAEAARQFQAVFDDWQRDQVIATRDIALAYFFAAENSYWQDKLDQAHAYQREALGLAIELQDDELICAVGVLNEFLNAATQSHGAEAEGMPAWPTRLTTRGVAEIALFMKTHAFLMIGRRDLARECMQRAGTNLSRQPTAHLRLPLLTYLYVAVAERARTSAIAPLLEDALNKAESSENRLYQLHLLALKAWQHWQVHGQAVANPALEEAVRLAEETGYVRVLLDIHGMARMLDALDGQASRRGEEVAQPSAQAVSLTRVEQNVLNLLATGRTYAEIADELMVGVNTVRTHVRHIYRKLSAHRRWQAVSEARRRGLLPSAPGHA